MKKIFILIILSVFLSEGFASTDFIIVTRNRRGLFGYKNVNETHTRFGHELDCSNPGTNRCKWQVPPAFVTNENPITEDDLNRIDETIETNITNGNVAGQFIYSTFFVTYSYAAESDNLSYKIYTFEEAKENGYQL